MTKYVYEHPAEAGVGEHHSGPDMPPLSERPAQVMGAIPPGALDFLDLTDEQRAKLEQVHTLTMADLDLPHGTVVTLVMNDDPGDPGFGQPVTHDGLVVVGWTDKLGTTRRTSITAAAFAEFFREVST